LAGTVTAAAVINIQTAAAEAGIPAERIIDALESVPYTVTWNDGGISGSAAELQTALRAACVAVGVSENEADLFVTKMIALDTGLTGTTTVPDVSSMTPEEARRALEAAGFAVGAVTATANRGNFLKGETDTAGQSPAASATDAPGTPVAIDIQLGQTVPDGATGGTGTGGAKTAAEMEAALTAVGLVGAGTDNLADSVTGVVSQVQAAGSYVEYGSTVTYIYDAI
jgi:hypothetical protein